MNLSKIGYGLKKYGFKVRNVTGAPKQQPSPKTRRVTICKGGSTVLSYKSSIEVSADVASAIAVR